MRWLLPGFLMCGLLLAFAGCTSSQYRKKADKEVASIITDKSRFVTNMDPQFTIEPLARFNLNGLPVKTVPDEFFGQNAAGTNDDFELGARMLTLTQALDIAIRSSRAYQNQKELLYIDALGLTLDRHAYTPIFSSGASTRYTSRQVETGIDHFTEERHGAVSGKAGVDWLVRSGGRLAADFTTDFIQFIGSGPRRSRLAASLSQPLLRGAGYKVTMERLTQAERNLLYSLREFTVYRKDFSITIASSYYAVLRNRDAVRNSWRSYQAFKENVARSRALANEGRLAQSELDRLQQAELSSETGWINSKRNYRQSLDEYKITLGLPVEAHLVLDDRDLRKLTIRHPELNVDDAVRVALANRLDLYTQRERVEDAERKVEVAKNAFLPGLDLVANVGVDGASRKGFSTPDFHRYDWSLGADLDLPLDRKAERNSFRGALINHARVTREYDLAMDQVRLQINDDWRNLDQARRNYENAELGVQLSQRRVEEQTLRAELGLGKALDLVDAQNALLSSQNELTAALINHSIARLRFWRDMGILMIEENGQWQDPGNGINK